jgi:hypothetical protein
LVAVVVVVAAMSHNFHFRQCLLHWMGVVVGEEVSGDGSGGCTGCDGDATIYGNSLMPSVLVHLFQ